MLYSQDEFDTGVASIVDDVYARVHRTNPAATHILDKHPGYSGHIRLMDRLVPGCKVLHIIRDGREVVVSMMSAKKRKGFGAGNILEASSHWAKDVRAARKGGALLGPDRYMELRYDELMANTAMQLDRVFRFIGLPMDHDRLERLAVEFSIENKQVSSGDKSLNALRKKPDAIWRNRLSLNERYIMDRMVGDLLQELGYAKPGWWALSTLERTRMGFYPVEDRLRRSFRQLHRIWATPAIRRVE